MAISLTAVFDRLSEFEQDFVDAEAYATGATRAEVVRELIAEGAQSMTELSGGLDRQCKSH